MSKSDAIFSLTLSPAEVHWLAGAFSITSLPLPEDPLHSLTAIQQKPKLAQALESLQKRDLVRSSGHAGWQVDRLPAAVVQWLGAAESMLVLDIHTRSGISQHARVFSEAGASMYVSLADQQFQFLFLPDRSAVSDYLLDRVGASLRDLEPAAAQYTFSQPVTVLRTAWTDPALAAKMLAITGIKPKESKSLLTWAGSVEWIVALSRVRFDEREAGSERKAVLCGNRQNFWAAHIDGKPDETVTLSPRNAAAIRAFIENLLEM